MKKAGEKTMKGERERHKKLLVAGVKIDSRN
jgi:hypothetical protein